MLNCQINSSSSTLLSNLSYTMLNNKGDFFIGQRVMVADEVFGTVCYIGPIPNSNGVWLGIDWDDFNRGRHNGTHNGITYFTATYPTSGSFIRPNKVSAGISFSESIDARYCRTLEQLDELRKTGMIVSSVLKPEYLAAENNSSQVLSSLTNFRGDANNIYMPHKHSEIGMISGYDPLAINNEDSCKDGRISFNNIQIELVGLSESMSKSDLRLLKQIVVHGMPVSFCTKEESQLLRDTFTSAYELNMAHTLVSDWSTVALLCYSMPQLSLLIISDNRIRLPTTSSSPYSYDLDQRKYYQINENQLRELQNQFKYIKQLIAVRMQYNWNDFTRILPWFPNLDKIVIAHNNIFSAPDLHVWFPQQINIVDLSGNKFESKEETQKCIDSLGLLPNLENILLSESNLSDFVIRNGSFPVLKQLGLSHNQISQWTTVSELDKLPQLIELTILENPIFLLCNNWETARQWTIARIEHLQMLNRNEVTKEERRGAEIDYLRINGQAWLDATTLFEGEDQEKLKEKRIAFDYLHPRYSQLVDIHGAAEIGELKKFTHALKEGLLELKITCPDLPNHKPFSKRIPVRTTVQHLLSLLRRMLKLKGSQQIRVTYTNDRMPGVEYDLDMETRELGFFDVTTGDTLVVHFM